MAAADGALTGQSIQQGDDRLQVMSAQVSALHAPLATANAEAQSTTTAATHEQVAPGISGVSSTTGEAIAGLGVTITMPAGEQLPNVPLGSMVRPQALVEAEQRMANAGVSGSEATLRLQSFPEGGCDRSSTPAPEAVASGGAGEAQSRQGGLRADLERSAGGVDRQVDGAAYVPTAEP